MKEHAKDYLNDYKLNVPLWEQVLIEEALLTNGNIGEDKIEEIYKKLSSGETTDEIKKRDKNESISNFESIHPIILKSLTHKSGVNALKENETIKFSSNCTILYGLNGTGKSGYFKILNEIVGGNQKKKILQNIYRDNNPEINIELSFEYSKSMRTITWNNTRRAIKPLNKIKVFDNSYLKSFLTERKADETLIQPFGLHLFSYIIEKKDEFKKRLEDDAEKIQINKPQIKTDNFSDKIKAIFEQNELSDETKIMVENLYNFSEEKQIELITLQKKLKDLNQSNIEDKIQLETIKYEKIKQLREEIFDSGEKLVRLKREVEALIRSYNQQKKESKTYKKQIKILKTIPKSDTSLWKEFISKGNEYSKLIDDSKVCPYCRQPLNDNAVKLLQAYTQFLNSEAENKLKEIKDKIEDKKRILNSINTDLSLDDLEDDIRKRLQEKTIKKEDKKESDLFSLIKEQINNYSKIKQQIEKAINERNEIEENIIIDNSKILEELTLLENFFNQNINSFKQDKNTKEENIKKLEEKIKPLFENKSISEQSNDIKKWFELETKRKNFLERVNSINTKKLTELSKKAHKELITERLKQLYSEKHKRYKFYKTCFI